MAGAGFLADDVVAASRCEETVVAHPGPAIAPLDSGALGDMEATWALQPGTVVGGEEGESRIVICRRADRDPDRGPSDPPRVFRTLNQHGVDYIVIGGWAVIAHGRVRTTLDVDFVADAARANLERLAGALAELRAELWGVDAHQLGIELDADTLASGANFTLTTDAGGLDFFNEVPGQVPYATRSSSSSATLAPWRRSLRRSCATTSPGSSGARKPVRSSRSPLPAGRSPSSVRPPSGDG